MGRGWTLVLGVASLVLACEARPALPPRAAGPTSLVLIHTADLHSHLFPERMKVNAVDAARGLGAAAQVSEVGGFARLASVVRGLQRGAAAHSLYLDSGDLIEGTAAFTEFGGEPELRAFSALGVGAAALGNHDLSPGASAFAEAHRRFAGFPVLAANVGQNGSELAGVLAPSVVLDAQGLRVGVVGVANPNSPSGLERADNMYGLQLLPTAAAVQASIDRLRSEADVIVAISHLGLDGDEVLIRATTGLDAVLGGHQHLALDAAQQRFDCGPALRAERGCSERSVVLVHSGALGHYVGELELSLSPRPTEPETETEGLEVDSARHALLPVSDAVAADPELSALLEPYRARLHAAGFDAPLAFALGAVERYANGGGDSALGDLITDAIRAHAGADLALINSTGIRANLPPGELTRAQLVAALPFDDRLTVLSVTGAQLRALLNQQARVASSRKCQTPIQISGFQLELTCAGSGSSAAVHLTSSARELDSRAIYSLVTSEYLASGGSGFALLTEVTSRRPLDADPVDVLLDALRRLPSCARSALPCLDPATLRDGRIVTRAGG